MKRERTARNIQIGFESFKVINQPKLDVNLRFSTNNMQRLAALLEPSEQEDFLLLWRPAAAGAVGAAPGGRDGSGSASNPSMITSKQSLCATAAQLASSALNSSSSSNSKATDAPLARRPSLLAAQASGTPVMETRSSNSSSSGGGVGLESSEDSDRDSDTASTDSDTTSNSDKTAGNDSNSSEAGSFGDNCTPFAAGAAWPGAAPDQKPHCCGAVLSAAQREEVCRMRGIPIQWRAFHINLGAFIYSTVFKMPLPPKMAPIIRPEIARWLGIKPNDMFVEHSCNLYA
jgi:hypothetical protein